MAMPKLSPEALRRRKDYNNQYRSKNLQCKCIPFNRLYPEDIALFDWMMQQPEGGNQYIKRLIREDMEARQEEEKAKAEKADV